MRQLVEISRALALCRISAIEQSLVLLDEPSSLLSGRDLARFFAIVERLQIDPFYQVGIRGGGVIAAVMMTMRCRTADAVVR